MDILILLIVGLLLGSFFNVCIYRIPKEESIAFPPSHCGSCNHALKPTDLIPVISYVLLKGKCRYCSQKISVQYPLVELLTAALFVWVYMVYGVSFSFLVVSFLTALLIIMTFIDLEHQIIPDGLVITGLIGGAVFLATGISVSWLNGLLGLLVGGGSFYFVAVLSEWILKKEGMGGGDIKLMAVIGLILGWKLTLLAILLSVYTGGLIGGGLLLFKIKKRGEHIPFGPFIAVGTFAAALYGNQILAWYLSTFLGLP